MDLVKKAHESYSNESMITNYIGEYDRTGRKDRILLIDVNCKNSSTGEMVYDLYEGLLKEGRTAAVCYGRGPVVDRVSTKVVKIIQSYTGIVDRMVWRKY